MELSDYRSQIDRIDAELLQLFAERMQTAAGIAAYKKSHGLPVLDAGREREKLAQIVKTAPEDLQEEAVSLYRLLFSLSRSYQRDLLDEKTTLPALLKTALEQTPQLFPPTAAVACQGVEGAYSQQACDKLFQHPSVFFCATFDKVFSAIEQGLCQYGVLPLENSTAGSVNAVYDLMQKHNFSIVRSVRLRVDHSLLALPGVKPSEIREIVSHGQALEQCSEFLKQLPNVTVTRCENTAAAARMVAESGRRDLAAVGVADEGDGHLRRVADLLNEALLIGGVVKHVLHLRDERLTGIVVGDQAKQAADLRHVTLSVDRWSPPRGSIAS